MLWQNVLELCGGDRHTHTVKVLQAMLRSPDAHFTTWRHFANIQQKREKRYF